MLEILRADNLDFPWLIHGFSTRRGGFSNVYGGRALNLGFTHDDSRAAVERNRAAFLQALGAGIYPLASVRQIHSDLIWPVVAPGPRSPQFLTAYDAALEPVPGNNKVGNNKNCHPERSEKERICHPERSEREKNCHPERSEGSAFRSPDHPITRSPDVHCGDGLLTSTPGLLLAIRTADCLPILLADPKRRAIAILHAGWRPTLKRIADKGVGEMRRWFGSRPEDLRAAIGPGIHSCCYQVGEEVRDQFHSQFAYAAELFTETKDSDEIHERYPLLFLVQRAPGHIEPHLPVKIRLDLVAANRRQLLDAGLRPRHITASPLCTACRTDLFFSYRAEKGITGRLMSVIGIRL